MPSTSDRANPDFYRGNARPSGSFAESVSGPLAGIVRLAKHNFGTNGYSNVINTNATNQTVPNGYLFIVDSSTSPTTVRHYFANDTGADVSIVGTQAAAKLNDARAKLTELFPE